MRSIPGLIRPKAGGRPRRQRQETLVLLGLVALLAIIPAILSPAFRTSQNVSNILNQIAPIGFVALGQTLPILTKGIDLSVGPLVSLTTVLAATLMGFDTSSVLTGLLICLAVGLAVGLVNGFITAYLSVPPLIATLGTMSVVNGVALMVLPYPGGYVPRPFTQAMLGRIGDVVPYSFVYFAVAALLMTWVMSSTRFGRRVYAVGGHEERARVAGINVRAVLMGVYVLSSLFATLGGLALAARMYSGDPTAGNPFTMTSVAAVLIGGTTFEGGRGGIPGTVLGVFVIGLLSVSLNLLGVSPFIQDIVSGAIVVLAVVSGVLRSKATRSRVVVIASPVYRDGAVVGVVCGAILTDSLLDRIRGLQLHDGIEAYLVDGEGKAATPARSVSSLDAPVETEGVAALLRRENGTGRYANAAGVLVLGVYRYLPEIGWGFVLELDETHALAAVNDLVRRLVTWLGIGALATLALAAADEVSGATEEMAASNEEVAEAGKALAAMARRLEEWVRRFRM